MPVIQFKRPSMIKKYNVSLWLFLGSLSFFLSFRFRFQEDEVSLIVQLLTSHPPPSSAGVRFVSLGLCMLIACPSLIGQQEHEKRSIEWVQWLVREEAYFERWLNSNNNIPCQLQISRNLDLFLKAQECYIHNCNIMRELLFSQSPLISVSLWCFVHNRCFLLFTLLLCFLQPMYNGPTMLLVAGNIMGPLYHKL